MKFMGKLLILIFMKDPFFVCGIIFPIQGKKKKKKGRGSKFSKLRQTFYFRAKIRLSYQTHILGTKFKPKLGVKNKAKE